MVLMLVCISYFSLTALQVLGSFIKLVATILDRSAADNGETTEGLNQQSGMLWKDESVSTAWGRL